MSKVSGQFSTLVKIPGATLGVNTTQYADNDLVGELMTPRPDRTERSPGGVCILYLSRQHHVHQ
jgi:hypothetical protein